MSFSQVGILFTLLVSDVIFDFVDGIFDFGLTANTPERAKTGPDFAKMRNGESSIFTGLTPLKPGRNCWRAAI